MTLPSFRLDGGVAFVTGAGGGIGAELAAGIAEAGAKVACVDLQAPEETAARIGEGALALAADVTDADALADAVAATERELGPLTFGINCAGLGGDGIATEMTLDDWRRMLDVNLTGVFASCQAQARVMLAHRGGAIVNVASMSGSIVNRDIPQAHYNASKAAVIQATKSLAMDWAPDIRVNAISPGYTATRMTQRPEAMERVKRFEADTPLGRMARPDEMVGPTVFLLSEAASYCTGVDLLVDGGFTCW
jgi:NAD(P)-dependent dehydrogenase (short-subunit alcohol dehydrogenase family)